jgi:hypothetical protein
VVVVDFEVDTALAAFEGTAKNTTSLLCIRSSRTVDVC